MGAAKIALAQGEPLVSAKAAALLISCGGHYTKFAASFDESGFAFTLKEALAVVQPSVMSDRNRELLRQTLAALVIAGNLEKLISAGDRDATVLFLGAAANGLKRKSDAQRTIKALGLFLRRHRVTKGKNNEWENYSGDAGARQVIEGLKQAGKDEFEYDTDDDEFEWA